MNTPTANAILDAIQQLSPTYVILDNESHKHAGYFDGKESHFKLVIVSDAFVDKRLIARHQMIYALTQSLMQINGGTIHAFAIHAYTPDEWTKQAKAPDSPNCAGQNK